LNWEQAIGERLDRILGKDTPPNLAAAIRYGVLTPGKRFRPRLMEASARTLSVPDSHSVPFAVALEWIHAFTLIHDDLPCMDDDDFRRGLPTNHKVYGEALALLAGDALVPAAFELTLESLATGCPAAAWRKAFSLLVQATGPRGVIGGQAREFLLDATSTLEELKRMHALKTGALFDAAILIPAHLAGIESGSPRFEALENFSNAFGLGFQSADDLEDAAEEHDEAAGYTQTSILSHLSFQQVRQNAEQALSEAENRLRGVHGTHCAPLLELSHQLKQKLAAAQDPGSRT
jgi:geranylgeranyl diphosphate synthase type II